jgi:hypothetical protein
MTNDAPTLSEFKIVVDHVRLHFENDRTSGAEASIEADVSPAELQEIDELRRLSLLISQPPSVLYTQT